MSDAARVAVGAPPSKIDAQDGQAALDTLGHLVEADAQLRPISATGRRDRRSMSSGHRRRTSRGTS